MTRSHKYVEDWVRVFYATLYVADQRHFIQFMFDGREHRWSRERMAELLGVPLRDRSLHSVIYDGVSPPYRGHAGTAPLLDQVGHLFRGEMLEDTPRTPDRLRPEFQLMLQILRRSLIPKAGFREGFTALQQAVLTCLTTFTDFDIVDIIVAEMEDVIVDGMPTRRQMPYAHWITHMLYQLGEDDAAFRTLYRATDTRFPNYRPAMRDDQRRGGRAARAVREKIPAEERAEVEAEDEELEAAEGGFLSYYYASSTSDSDYDDEEEQARFFPPARHDAEAGGSGEPRPPSPPPAPQVSQAQVTQPDALQGILQALLQQQAEHTRVQQQQTQQLLSLHQAQLDFQRETRDRADRQEARHTLILEEIRTSLRDQRQEYRHEIDSLRSEVRGALGLPQSQPTLPAPPQMTLPALPEFTPSIQLADASTPGTFPLSPLLRTDPRPVLSPLPATTLTFESPAQGPSVTAAASSSGPSRRDLLEQTVEPVIEQITQPASSQAILCTAGHRT
ncbi:hypothetical protein U9M48_020292 [Paspalum notatum var. saurae]|uniref:Uncharacterized protein n=1 Tax=Paspalum notatum var. saurae TaxID=547442 RepID=A0AAQ3TES0_PASNO